MKTTQGEKKLSRKLHYIFARAFTVAGFLLCTVNGRAQLDPGGGTPLPDVLGSWSFHDKTNWTSDLGYTPVSFTNLNFSYLGNGSSLVVDTNVPAWLQYNAYEGDGTTNLTVDQGTVTFWFAPSWSSTNQGGLGPQEWGRLFEVGSYTADSSYGLWSIYVDEGGNNIYFSAQTNDLSSSLTTYLCAPISWVTNYFHFVAVTYSATNTALYLDGVLVTNGPPLTVYPGEDVLANGFYIGSDSNGLYQAEGLFNTVATYNYPLDTNTVRQLFNWDWIYYMISPWNTAMSRIVSAGSNPSSSPTLYQAITGIGSLQLVGAASSCTSSTNIWITNVVATVAGNGTMNLTFAIEGGSNNIPYDVFANSVLGFGTNDMPWAWMGQGNQCNVYSLTNLPTTACFLILGTPQDSDSDGLTDAYEKLVSKTDPNNPDTDGDGLSDAWEVLLGLNPLLNDNAQSTSRSNYSYDLTDWLEGISGIRTGSVSLDNEGNVQTVSQ